MPISIPFPVELWNSSCIRIIYASSVTGRRSARSKRRHLLLKSALLPHGIAEEMQFDNIRWVAGRILFMDSDPVVHSRCKAHWRGWGNENGADIGMGMESEAPPLYTRASGSFIHRSVHSFPALCVQHCCVWTQTSRFNPQSRYYENFPFTEIIIILLLKFLLQTDFKEFTFSKLH